MSVIGCVRTGALVLAVLSVSNGQALSDGNERAEPSKPASHLPLSTAADQVQLADPSHAPPPRSAPAAVPGPATSGPLPNPGRAGTSRAGVPAAAPATDTRTTPPTAAAPSAAQLPPQSEGIWYNGDGYSFNLINIEYYDRNIRYLHFSGQSNDIRNNWPGLAALLYKSKDLGFVELDNKYINVRNLSSIHRLNGGQGTSLTFRDGATLNISSAETDRLIQATQ